MFLQKWVRELVALSIVLILSLSTFALAQQQPGRLIPPPAQTPSPQPSQTPSPEPQNEPSPQPQPSPAEPQATPSQEATPAQAAPAQATSAQPMPVLWREPSDIASRNLYLGPGGEDMKPDLTKVTFIRQEPRGHTTKYRVRDGQGRVWVVKLGNEAQSETVASHLVWAAGYFTDIDYFVPEVKIEGKGTVKNVRFEARPKQIKRFDQEWDWDNNPFAGTNELQGLKVFMVLLNNWDLKTANNRVLLVHNEATNSDELRYIISDLGATFGKTGNFITHNRNQPGAYAATKLIKRIEGDHIIFDFRATHDQMLRNVTVAQAKWLGTLLSQLSDQQIGDAFRAANYSPDEIQILTKSVRSRIDELVNLPG
ncbi:MAG: hypothetical protein AUG51_19680 [Acidobacteria bacterium 13_1_20CM_3_53_8]|nr:MAG: hypothetical protein AUG51_19680 [Acidobacteria bacterium 13_1_20CM_3_53_8]